MRAISSREVIHSFAKVAAQVAAGEELMVTRYGKPLLRLSPASTAQASEPAKQALLDQVLSIRMTQAMGGKFQRSDAYDE